MDFSIIKPKIFKFISLYEKYEIKDSTIEAKNMKLRSFYKTNMEIASKKDKARQENISALEKLVKDSKYIEAYSNLVAYNDIQITNSPVGIKIKTIHDEVQANLSACYDSIEKGNEVAAHTLRKKILSICVDADLNKISSYLKPKKVEGGKITIEKDDDGAYYAHITFNASKSKGIQYVLLKKENSSSTSYTDGEQIIIDDNLYYDDYEIHSNTTYYYSIYTYVCISWASLVTQW